MVVVRISDARARAILTPEVRAEAGSIRGAFPGAAASFRVRRWADGSVRAELAWRDGPSVERMREAAERLADLLSRRRAGPLALVRRLSPWGAAKVVERFEEVYRERFDPKARYPFLGAMRPGRTVLYRMGMEMDLARETEERERMRSSVREALRRAFSGQGFEVHLHARGMFLELSVLWEDGPCAACVSSALERAFGGGIIVHASRAPSRMTRARLEREFEASSGRPYERWEPGSGRFALAQKDYGRLMGMFAAICDRGEGCVARPARRTSRGR